MFWSMIVVMVVVLCDIDIDGTTKIMSREGR